MNAASQMPSGVLISTSFSTRSAASAEPAAAAMPAATDSATKSRRERSSAIACSFATAIVAVLFVAKGDHRVDERRAAGGDGAGGERDRSEHDRDGGKRPWIARLHAVHERRHGTAEGEAAREADADPEGADGHAFADDQTHHARTLRP